MSCLEDINGDDSIRMRVVSYNVHGGVDAHKNVDIHKAAKIIGEIDADVIALQEVDAQMPVSENRNQARSISEFLGLDYRYYPLEKAGRHAFGLAILSRYPVAQSDFILLPNLYPWLNMRKRGAMRVALKTPKGRIFLINTHLSVYKLERYCQLNSLLCQYELPVNALNEPIILCGDLNAGPSDLICRILSRHLTNVQKTPNHSRRAAPTFPSKIPVFRIDHIFVSNHCKPLHFEVIKNSQTQQASDHLPIVADLRLLFT